VSALSRRTFVAGLLASPVIAACGGGEDQAASAPTSARPSTTTSSTTTTSTTAPPPPTQPLTGLVHQGDPAVLQRPALVVKINNIDTNTDQGRPQSGINQADVVFEERTEGGISRFAAVFQSTDADPVLPVRSARLTDLEITSMLNRPLFANSGGNRTVMGAVHAANLVPVGHEDVGNAYYYRVPGRRAPHNLASSTPALYSLTPAGSLPPAPLFTYREPGTPPANGVPSNGVYVEYGGGPAQAPVEYHFDPVSGGWARWQNGTPHVDTIGEQVNTPNLIVQFIQYDGTRGILTGSGEAWVFTGGQLVAGSWQRPDPNIPTAFLDSTGAPIALTPGRTWVLLPPPGGGRLL
jgi:Protein of unknown function (DUF3048) N-terminal domain/Protein of unknown function (DUF3048) C-terminal domain